MHRHEACSVCIQADQRTQGRRGRLPFRVHPVLRGSDSWDSVWPRRRFDHSGAACSILNGNTSLSNVIDKQENGGFNEVPAKFQINYKTIQLGPWSSVAPDHRQKGKFFMWNRELC